MQPRASIFAVLMITTACADLPTAPAVTPDEASLAVAGDRRVEDVRVFGRSSLRAFNNTGYPACLVRLDVLDVLKGWKPVGATLGLTYQKATPDGWVDWHTQTAQPLARTSVDQAFSEGMLVSGSFPFGPGSEFKGRMEITFVAIETERDVKGFGRFDFTCRY